MQIVNEGIELAHIFAPAFFRFQFALAHHDRQIPNVVESFPGQIFGSFVPSHRHNAFGQIELQARGVGSNCPAQIASHRVQFIAQHCDGRDFPLCFLVPLFFSFHWLRVRDVELRLLRVSVVTAKKARRASSPNGLSLT
jgi:hypothetical protein